MEYADDEIAVFKWNVHRTCMRSSRGNDLRRKIIR
jgi:hypothetical protein